MVPVALLYIATGVVVGVLGIKLFRLLLPIMGLVGGIAVGFSGFQSVFGTGKVSTVLAFLMALLVGALLALLSFAFVEVALIVYTALLGGSIFSFIGVSLGLGEGSLILPLLSIVGFIVGIIIASQQGFTQRMVVWLSALAGSALSLVGVFLLVGKLSLTQLHEQGIIHSLRSTVDTPLLWILVWLAAASLLIMLQQRTSLGQRLSSKYEFTELEMGSTEQR